MITRPSGQSQNLIHLLQSNLRSSGLSSEQLPQIISLPLLNIVPKSDASLRSQIQASLKAADLIIFVSPNAVECTKNLLNQPWRDVVNQSIPIGVMGGSSQTALKQYDIDANDGLSNIIYPKDNSHWDSEGLWNELQKLAWDWSAKKVLIFKGEGGRDWLSSTLQNAGAQVELISVYSRTPLDFKDPAWLAVQDIDFSQSLWLLTSSEAVRYLGKASLPVDTAVAICPHHRIADAAKKIGFREALICQPGDISLAGATQAWLQI